MKYSPLLRFLTFYLLTVILMALERPFFMLFNPAVYSSASVSDYIDVIYHGLSLDFAAAGYLSIIPGIIGIASPWIAPRIVRTCLSVWCFITSFIVALSFLTDTALYPYWGSKLDVTPLIYFVSSPKGALASIEVWQVIALFLVLCVLTLLLFILYSYLVVRRDCISPARRRNLPPRLLLSAVMLVATALLFIPIRGGFSVSTNKLSRA